MGDYTQLEITRPMWFAALAAIPLLVVFWRWSLWHFPRRQRMASLVVRGLVLTLIVAALAGLRLRGRSEPAMSLSLPAAPVAPPIAPADVEILSITGPREVRRGEPFGIDVSIRAEREANGKLQVSCGSDSVSNEPVKLTKGVNRFHFDQAIVDGTSAVYTAHLDCGNGPVGNAFRGVPSGGTPQRTEDGTPRRAFPTEGSVGCVVLVGRRPKVLVIESQPVLAERLAAALKQENIDVEVRPPQDLPGEPAGLHGYDLVVLSNVPATAMPRERMAAVQEFVRDYGGGLIVVGGEQSLTPGGYRGTPLEEALPVISEVNKKKPRPGLAMAIVLDISGSMGEGPADQRSIDLAKEALRRAVGTLGPRDQVGVLAFEDRSHWIAPLGPATDKQKIIDSINAIEAGGETSMYMPLEQAYLALREAYADMKHIIVLTDGVSNPGDFDGLAKKIAAEGITMSTVGVGAEPARPLLTALADRTKGHAYFPKDARALPNIFEMETKEFGKIGITEGAISPQPGKEPSLDVLKAGPLPTLLGYVDTQAKPAAEVMLSSPTGDPLLATWHYGKGTSVAFTSDIKSRWAAAWLAWPGFGKFWVQLVRQTLRHVPPSTCMVTAEPFEGRLHVVLDAIDTAGRFINLAEASLTLTGSDGKSPAARLEQVAPARYVTSLPTAPGVYYLETRVSRQGQSIDEQRLGVVVPKDKPGYGLDRGERVGARAAALEGPVAASATGISVTSHEVPRRLALWPWLLGAALLLLLVDLYLKRVAWGKL